MTWWEWSLLEWILFLSGILFWLIVLGITCTYLSFWWVDTKGWRDRALNEIPPESYGGPLRWLK